MDITDSIKQKILKFSDKNSPADILHGKLHRDRVIKHAELINTEVKADWDIVYISALCHDIGHSSGKENHQIASAHLAGSFLKSINVETQIIDRITHCILTHSRQFAETRPETAEAKVLYDADGMDLFGAVGISRAILSCGLNNKGYDCMMRKLQWRLKIASDFFSHTAKEYVDKKCEILKTYVDLLEAEIS